MFSYVFQVQNCSPGGIARLVGKILWLTPDNPDLQSEIQGWPYKELHVNDLGPIK